MIDVAPQLISCVMTDFNEYINNEIIEELLKEAKVEGADYSIAYRYAIEVNACLNKALRKNVSADKLPDGRLYYNIAQRLFNTALNSEHGLVSSMAKEIQETLNRDSELGIKAIVPSINYGRIEGIAKAVAFNQLDPQAYGDVIEKKLFTYTENFSMSIVDDAIKANASFQNELGLDAVITRISNPGACKWCIDLEGVYNYEEIRSKNNPVFQRHTNCKCIVLYKSSRDVRYADVHMKGQYDTESVDRMIDYSNSMVYFESREDRVLKANIFNHKEQLRQLKELKNRQLIASGERQIINDGENRARQYRNNWRSASLIDAIKRIAPHAKPYYNSHKGKLYFRGNGYEIIYDVMGNYFRIENLNHRGKKREYVGLNMESMYNVTIHGKTRGRTVAERNAATHFANIDF